MHIDLGRSLLFRGTSNYCIPMLLCKEKSRGVQLLSTHPGEPLSTGAAAPITCRKTTSSSMCAKGNTVKLQLWDTRVSRAHISFLYSTNHLLTQLDSDLYLSAKFIISWECPCQGKFSSQLHLAVLSLHFTPLISDLTLPWAHRTLSQVGTLCQISHRAGQAASVWCGADPSSDM